MAKSEFRWNKKRKHYAYLFKDLGDYRKNLLIHSDPSKKEGWNKNKFREFDKKYTRLFRHPNPNKSVNEKYYIENRVYVDHQKSFHSRIYPWNGIEMISEL